MSASGSCWAWCAPTARARVVLFNISTSVTLALATAAHYAALFAVGLLGAAVVIPPAALEENVRHAVDIGDYLRLVWLVASVATAAGALGSLIDSDEAVRNAVYHRDQIRMSVHDASPCSAAPRRGSSRPERLSPGSKRDQRVWWR